MKRKVSLLIALVLIFMIAGCGPDHTQNEDLGPGTWQYYGSGHAVQH